MVFIDAGAAHRVQHDITQIYEAIARLLAKIHLEGTQQKQETTPRIDIEVEEEKKQMPLEGQPTPAVSGQLTTFPGLEGQREELKLEGRDFAALPYRDLEPSPFSPEPLFDLDSMAVPVKVQFADAVIERPLNLLPQALEKWHPEQVAALRKSLEYPTGTGHVDMDNFSTRIEVNGIERFKVAQGQVQINDLYPAIVAIRAEAIAAGKENATSKQVEDLSRYLLEKGAQKENEQRYLSDRDDSQTLNVTSTASQSDLNTIYRFLHQELERQQTLPHELSRQPEMQLRSVSEAEVITGQQFGDIEVLHAQVLSQSPVILVSVDDLGRPIPTRSVVSQVEVTEDKVETEAIQQEVKSDLQEEQRMAFPALEQLQTFFEQTGVKELGSPEMGISIQPQDAGLLANTSSGHTLFFDGDRVLTNFSTKELEQLGNIAQEVAYALATQEMSIGTVQQVNQEMERG